MEIALCVSIALNFVQMVAMLFYFAKTTWHAQNKQSEMEKLLSMHQLASHQSTQPMVGPVGNAFTRAQEAERVPMGETVVGHDAMGRLVRVPLSSESNGMGMPNLFDEESDIEGN